MKKGIVMELHRQYTIIMTKNGSYHKAIPIKDAEIGAEVTYEPLDAKKSSFVLFYPGKKLSKPIRLIAMACIVLLVVLPLYFAIGEKETTYAYVNIDINPSIELEIDESLQVKKILPLNKDASIIIDKLAGYENKQLETVIEMIMTKSEDTGLIANGKHMLVGVSYVAEDKIKKFTVLDHLKRYLMEGKSDWKVAAFKVPENIRRKAKKSKKSMNEVMATTLIEAKNISNNNSVVDDKDKAIINSFYSNDHNDKESNMKESKETPDKTNNMEQHDINKKEINRNKKNEQGISGNKDKNDRRYHKHTKSNKSKNVSRNNEKPKFKVIDRHKSVDHHKKGNKGKHKGNKQHQDNGKHKGHDKKNKQHKDNGKHKGHDNGKNNH